MKKFFKTFFLVLFAVCALCALAACNRETKGLRYELNKDGESYTVAGLDTARNKRVVIPAMHAGKPVTAIGQCAFDGHGEITSVAIPDSVTEIGPFAFMVCSKLKNVTIPQGVTEIETETFSRCYSLKKIELPNGITSIGSGAFSDCIGLTSITIPDSVTRIESSAFSFCSGLTSITIPDSVTSVGYSAFKGCNRLESVKWDASCEEEDDGRPIFGGCNQIKNITIGENAALIPDSLYKNHRSIQSITVDGENKDFCFVGGCLIETESKTLLFGFDDSKIPADGSVTSIGAYAFANCRDMRRMYIPDSVKHVGYHAFYGCEYMAGVYITDISAWCGIDFADREANPLYYAHKLYLNSELVTELTIPDGVTKIGSYAFGYCPDITSVTIPDSVTEIDFGAFIRCENIAGVYITDLAAWCSITFDGYCSNPLFFAPQLYLNGTPVCELTLPDGITEIKECAFENYYCLTGVTIPRSLTSIGSWAFGCCENLTDITFQGMKEEWNALTKGFGWNTLTGEYTVHCDDGDVLEKGYEDIVAGTNLS